MFRLLCLLRVSGPSLEHLPRRMLGSALIAWLPLLVLAALEGNAFGGDTALPLLRDWETGLRFLVALPLLFWADVVSHRQLGRVVAQFRAREMIPQAQLERFDAALRSATRLRDSTLAELVLVAFVFELRRPRGLAQGTREFPSRPGTARQRQPGRRSPWQGCG